MINTRAIEDEIIAHLDTAGVDTDTGIHIPRFGGHLGGLDIEAYPGNPETYNPLSPLGAVLVIISGEQFGQPVGALQRGKLRIVITLILRNLASHTDLYPYRDALITHLNGFGVTAAGGNPLIPMQDQFVSFHQGQWQRDLIFSLDQVHVATACPCT